MEKNKRTEHNEIRREEGERRKRREQWRSDKNSLFLYIKKNRVFVSGISAGVCEMGKGDAADGGGVFDLVSPKSVYKRRSSKIMTRQAAKDLRSSKINQHKSFYDSLPLYSRAKRLRGIKDSDTMSKDQKKLDTNMFELHLEYLWSNISDDNGKYFTYLDCLWFSLYKKGPAPEKVLLWIRRKKIFSRKYVFVPIICWRHWSLLILCHFGEKSKTKKPCMLLLDSLGMTDPKRLEQDIRRFVWDIYKSEGRQVKEDTISKIPLLVPKVPQQRNGDECGIFVLYYIYLFLKNAPESFSQKDYPYFLTENWFSLEDIESFRKEIDSFCKEQQACGETQ